MFSWKSLGGLMAMSSLIAPTMAGENWAVIIASSCGYDNYRH